MTIGIEPNHLQISHKVLRDTTVALLIQVGMPESAVTLIVDFLTKQEMEEFIFRNGLYSKGHYDL